MREYTVTIPLKGGLRAWGAGPANQGGLEECYNLKPYKEKLIAYSPMTLPLSSIGMDWPYPQLFCLIEANYLCEANGIRTLSSGLVTTATLATSASTAIWTVADFHDYVVFCNGANLYVRNPSTGVVAAYGGSDLYTGRSICSFKGQIICSAPTGYDANVVMWSDIGRANMDPADSVVAGWAPMPWAGTTQMVKRLGDHIVAYGDGGVAMLTPFSEPNPGFKLTELSSLGVSGQAVGGDIHQHLYVREDGMLARVIPNPEYPRALMIQELGYVEFFSPMLGNDIMVSYDPALEEYYISNGTSGYLLAKDGLCEIFHYVASCQFYSGGLVGTAIATAAQTAFVQTSDIDFQHRGNKAIEYLEVQTNKDLSATGYWKNDNDGSYSTAPTVAIRKVGANRYKLSGMDLKIRLAATSLTGLELDYLTIHWKDQDRRFRRGLNAGKASA